MTVHVALYMWSLSSDKHQIPTRLGALCVFDEQVFKGTEENYRHSCQTFPHFTLHLQFLDVRQSLYSRLKFLTSVFDTEEKPSGTLSLVIPPKINIIIIMCTFVLHKVKKNMLSEGFVYCFIHIFIYSLIILLMTSCLYSRCVFYLLLVCLMCYKCN